MPSLKVPEGAQAINQLKIYTTDEQAQPKRIKLWFSMPHYEGWFDTVIPSRDHWTDINHSV